MDDEKGNANRSSPEHRGKCGSRDSAHAAWMRTELTDGVLRWVLGHAGAGKYIMKKNNGGVESRWSVVEEIRVSRLGGITAGRTWLPHLGTSYS